MQTGEASDRAAAIRLLLLDVDGVLTDGRFLVAPDGGESKTFHARDGLGLRLLLDAGIEVGIITGRKSEAVTHRSEELGLGEVHQGVADKSAVFDEILSRRGLTSEQVGYVGDDLVDLPVLRRVGFAATVADGEAEIQRYCHLVTRRGGGHGAVREIAEHILRSKGLWQKIIRHFGAMEEEP
jgi:3-deoxy-D-manno-octulosonate 8-phosphate phosphatase (KDO 8-P phosphatase)